MPVALRLMRFGKKKKPVYRIVAIDKRKKRDGRYLDLVGFYDPLTSPAEVKINEEKLKLWLRKGAEISDGLVKLLKKKRMFRGLF